MYYILTKSDCPHCDRAKALLDKQGEAYHAFSYDSHPMIAKLMVKAKLTTVPQIWLEKTYIGTADDLESHFEGVDESD